MYRSRRKTYKLKTIGEDEEPLSVTRLPWATNFVRRVIFLAEDNLVVAASTNNKVRVYDVDTSGEPCSVFKRYTKQVRDVVQLDSDVVALVGSDGKLFTWRPASATAELIGEWEHPLRLWSVAKLGESEIIVGDYWGNVPILSHQSAISFQIRRFSRMVIWVSLALKTRQPRFGTPIFSPIEILCFMTLGSGLQLLSTSILLLHAMALKSVFSAMLATTNFFSI